MNMNNKHRIGTLIALMLVTTLGAFAQSSKDTIYVQVSDMPNAVHFLPAPPDTASMEFTDDLIQWQWGKTQRPTPRGKKSSDESPWEPRIMERIISECLQIDTISKEATPALHRLLLRAYNTGNKSTSHAKRYYMRKRPFVQMGEETWAAYDTDFLRTNGSYPSGHTALGWGTTLVFAEMWPELQDTLLRRGFEFGENRIITGAHYQSDVTAGYMCSSAGIARGHNHPEFEKDIKAARAEYIKLKGLPANYDPTAAAGMPRGEKILNAAVDTTSYRYLGDLARLWSAQKLQGTERGALAVEHADCSDAYLMKIFGQAMNITVSPEKTPAIAELVSMTKKYANEAATALKNTHFRKRPFVQLKEATPLPQEEESHRTTSSFASTHANTGWALALVLTEVAPERQNEILKLGFDYGYDRVIIGYHWSSDVEAGRLLGCAVVARLNANDSFGKLIKKARAEYQKASKK